MFQNSKITTNNVESTLGNNPLQVRVILNDNEPLNTVSTMSYTNS